MEKHRKIIIGLLGLVTLAFGIGLVFAEPVYFGLCEPQERFSCIGPLGNYIGEPLVVISISLALALFVLLFLSQKIFTLWWKWTIIILPVSAFLILITPVQCRAPLGICLDKEMVSLGAAILFLLISVTLIVYKRVKLRKAKD